MVLVVLVIRTVPQVRRVSEGRWVVSSLQTACAPKDQSKVEIQHFQVHPFCASFSQSQN